MREKKKEKKTTFVLFIVVSFSVDVSSYRKRDPRTLRVAKRAERDHRPSRKIMRIRRGLITRRSFTRPAAVTRARSRAVPSCTFSVTRYRPRERKRENERERTLFRFLEREKRNSRITGLTHTRARARDRIFKLKYIKAALAHNFNRD